MEEITRKYTKNQMQEQLNDFGRKYGNQKDSVKAIWINNMTKELEGLEKAWKQKKHRFTQNDTKKNIKRENGKTW